MRRIDRIAAGATLFAPLVLLHGRALADVALTLVGVLFLVRSALLRDWSWLRRTWVRVALAWWGWLVVCSVPWRAELLQALGVIRFPLLAAALEHWVLSDMAVRRWLVRLLRWSAFYLAAQCLLQFATGRSLFGWPRGADGELTGPYKNPRAGAPLSRLLFPALLPLARTPLRALALLAGGVGIMVLIGQRMPLLLTFLGLFTTALFLKPLRGPVLFTALGSALLLAALPAVSPEAAHRIESKFAAQMADLPDSQYGLIAARSVAIVRANPVFGAGFDGFRRLCEDPRFFQGWDGGTGGGADICVQHPHNYYLQATVEGGIPGLVLFASLALAWMIAIGRGLLAAPDPLRVGLFAAALIHLWPVASSMDWASMPLSGWFFLQLGLALAEARPYMRGQRISFEA
jgi:O-antigen ligase